MPTTLASAELGPFALPAPEAPPRQITGEHGRMWQWVGDGEDLFTLSVAVRETRQGNATGCQRRLDWEVKQLVADRTRAAEVPSVEDVGVQVDGATGAAAADVVAQVRGNEVRDRVVVTTDGDHMHVVRVVVPDTDEGRGLAREVTAGLRVQPWSRPLGKQGRR